MLLEYMTEVQNASVVYKDNQWEIFLEKYRKVRMRTKHIHTRNHFLRDMVKDKDINIKYIRSEKNHAYNRMKNCSEAGHFKKMRRITKGELWEIVETGR